uniref:Uncharacterized protein n=1 Tax=Lepeophtheirus salmonis TaxID=72036 RepID=A0A0K2T742_LEPSM
MTGDNFKSINREKKKICSSLLNVHHTFP